MSGHVPARPAPDHPREELLELARAAVIAAVRGCPAPDPGGHPGVARPGDAFVTLTIDGELRGCIGTLAAGEPVGAAVVHAATMAATRDPRFRPVGVGDLAQLQLEVSLLGPSRGLADPGDFVAGRDGIVVEADGRRAVLLPQVAEEMGWGRIEMLEAACRKAGLGEDAWRDPATRLSTFEVVRASGPVLRPGPAPTPAPCGARPA